MSHGVKHGRVRTNNFDSDSDSAMRVCNTNDDLHGTFVDEQQLLSSDARVLLGAFVRVERPVREPHNTHRSEEIEHTRPSTPVLTIDGDVCTDQHPREREADDLPHVHARHDHGDHKRLLLQGDPHRDEVIHAGEGCTLEKPNDATDDQS